MVKLLMRLFRRFRLNGSFARRPGRVCMCAACCARPADGRQIERLAAAGCRCGRLRAAAAAARLPGWRARVAAAQVGRSARARRRSCSNAHTQRERRPPFARSLSLPFARRPVAAAAAAGHATAARGDGTAARTRKKFAAFRAQHKILF